MKAAKDLPLRYVARITIEFATPFAVRSGRGDLFSDSVFVEDANGLPAIPGSSIAGVLRHACRRAEFGAEADVFGPLLHDGEDAGAGSRLAVSWAAIHDSCGRPVEGLLDPAGRRAADPVLANARRGVVRDHVRLNDRGTAEEHGKYEETLVAAGHRFTFELALTGNGNDADIWRRLLGLLQWPGLRLGGGTRRGFGAFRVIAVHEGCFDLRDKDGFAAYCALPVSLGDAGALSAREPGAFPATAPAATVDILLDGFGPREPWLFGNGVADTGEDFAPVAETIIRWAGEKATVSERPVLVVPASAIKGVLSHRLAWNHNLFRARRSIGGDWAEAGRGAEGGVHPAVRAVFGEVKGRESKAGRVGRMVLDDLFVPQVEGTDVVRHVSVDGFTGGARRGRLFSERVARPGHRVDSYRLTIVNPDAVFADTLVLDALAATLGDLRKGRLTFGSGGGRGNGRFACEGIRVLGEGPIKERLEALLKEDAGHDR